MNIVPQQDPGSLRLAVIEPAEGLGGQEWLSWLLSGLKHPLDRCFRGYLTSPTLAAELAAWRPNVVVLMGDEALRAFHEDRESKAANWRGSLFHGTLNLAGVGAITSPLETEGGSGVVTPVGLTPASHLDGGNAAGMVCTLPMHQSGTCLTSTPVGSADASAGPSSPLGGAYSEEPDSSSEGSCSVAETTRSPFPLAATHGAARDAQTWLCEERLHETRGGLPFGGGVDPAQAVRLPDSSGCLPTGGFEHHRLSSLSPQGHAGHRRPSTDPACAVNTAAITAPPCKALGESAPVVFKCLCALHPSDPQLRLPEWSPLLRFDLARAVSEAGTPELVLPERRIEWQLSAVQIVSRLRLLVDDGKRVGIDLEGYPATGITDLSIATTITEAFWIPLTRLNHARWWSADDENAILLALKAVIESPRVGKVGHNLLYEGLVFHHTHGWTLRGISGDTLLKAQSLHPELERNLSTAASLLTRQPYWGESSQAATNEQRARYNCLDSMVSLEVDSAIDALPEWTPAMRSHYEARVALLPAALWQVTHGVSFDGEARTALLSALDRDILEAQGQLDALAGIKPPTLQEVTQTVCAKRSWGKVVTWEDVVPNANPIWLKRSSRTLKGSP